MDAPPLWLTFLLAALAAWRLSVFLVNEDGPFHLAARVRALAKGSELARTFDCIACTSLLISLPAGAVVAPRAMDIPLCWLAVAGAVLLVERLTADRLTIEAVASATETESEP